MIWQVIAASTMGSSHARTNLPCQDAHGYRVHNNFIVAAAADGLGSASKSQIGARLATDTALDTVESALHNGLYRSGDVTPLLADAFIAARRALRQFAESNETSPREYATTLLIAVVTRGRLATAHLGDGAIVARYNDNAFETVSPPQRGEFANEVVPLTASDALAHVRYTVRTSPPKALALLTDGLQNLCINHLTQAPFSAFFCPFFDAVCRPLNGEDVSAQLAQFLDSDRICAKTDDDKTLVVVGQTEMESALMEHAVV